jgi:four helix bundle protein
MTIKRFEDLEIWQKARELCKKIRGISETTPLGKDFSIKDQILRSSGSVMDNIAEGFERDGKKEFINFLYIYQKGHLERLDLRSTDHLMQSILMKKYIWIS